MALKHKDLIARMTLEEKCSLLSGKDFWQTMDFDHLGIPSIFLSDGPNGLRKQAGAADHLGLNVSVPATCFPTSATSANSWDPELLALVGRTIGEEAVVNDVSILLGPGTNIKRNPRCGRNFEYFSEDPYLSGKLSAGYVKGLEENGISACIKHFACNNQELRRIASDSVVDERALREIYLPAFEMAVKEGNVTSLMTSYNKLNGTYTNEHEHLMIDILRKEWGFKGLVVTDWGGENDRIEGLRCLNALEMPGNGGETNHDVMEAVKAGNIEESVIDENVDNFLEVVFKTHKALENHPTDFERKGHHNRGLEVARESVVLLKNEGNILPLPKRTKVAVVGDFFANARYEGAGSSNVNALFVDQAEQNIGEYGWDVVGYAKGFDRYGKADNKLVNEALSVTANAEVTILFCGLDELTEAEGLDRDNIELPKNQRDLIHILHKAGRKLVLVLECGSVIEMPFKDEVEAIVHPYLGGEGGAKAILEVIAGVVNPSGKLAESYPIKYEDCPSADNFAEEAPTTEYRESIFVGYRYYLTAEIPMAFPFGHGLSYTTFEYSDLAVDEKGVSFTLKNTGKLAGKEVAQLYIGLKNSFVPRPKYELKGFKKVHLEPGESKKVEIPFDEYSFRYFNVKTNKWEVEKGDYDVYIGSSCTDIRLTGSIHQEGTEAPAPYDLSLIPCYASGKVRHVPDEEFKIILGREIPSHEFDFIVKKNGKKSKRIIIKGETNMSELRYSKLWAGRFFAWALRFAIKHSSKATQNMLIMGIYNFPVRAMSRMMGGAISTGQLDALIYFFNGHWHAGLHRFFKAGRAKKRYRKEIAASLEKSREEGFKSQGLPVPPREDPKAKKKREKAEVKAAKKNAKKVEGE